MSNYGDLLKNTFDNGTVHIKFLEQIIRALVNKLNLQQEEIDCETIQHDKRNNDPASKLITSNYNQLDKIVNLLNLTKRIEALEISVQKVSSVIHTILTKSDVKESLKVHPKSEIVNNEINMTDKLEDEKELENIIIQTSSFGSKIVNEKSKEQQIRFSNSSNDSNHYDDDICKLEEKINSYDEKCNDLFYACEENEEKIDQIFKTLDDLKSNESCLKFSVQKVMDELDHANKKILHLTTAYENLEHSKANQSYVDDVVVNELCHISSKVNDLNKLFGNFSSEHELLNATLLKFDESFRKFYKNVQQSLFFLNSQVADKLNKKALKDFKTCISDHFDKFISELKIFLMTKESIASGTTKSLMSNLKCMSCENDTSMKKESNTSETHARQHVTENKSPSKSESTEQMFNCIPKDSLLDFPIQSQQCFIISRDNTIYKADAMRCLLNPNYTKF